ncbi:MAG: addiction module toxin, HicA family [Bryobacteraceae bacterium]
MRPIPPSDAPLIRHSARHDWYRNPKTGVAQPVPRHREIKEFLAAHILKKLVG